ncbi:MAG TPA: amino acid adenylation domain-containing protein, partial [Thermoanaerobaculia bacterium]|nr:amino acid adenylation domain-containing protein [Thermoanaerobaculia bacterium]
YRELDERASRLASHLMSLGVCPGSLVGIHLRRSLHMLPALLAVFKAGAAYVPQEVGHPPARLRWLLEALEISCVLTETAQLGSLPAVDHVICLDREEIRPIGPIGRMASPDDLAYVIFTSGSTGTPKGVMVRHRPVVNLIRWAHRTFDFSPADRVLFVTSLSFDLSVFDVFGLLAAGGSIRIATEEEVREPERLLRALAEEPITFWDSAPAALEQTVPFLSGMNPETHPALRLVFLSGDWIPVTLPDRVRARFPGARVVSLGGATEATVWSNVFPIGEVDPSWTSIPYGRPIDNARYHVLDGRLAPCPVGVPGDLHIGGGCLANGYAREPELTADRFLPDPWSFVPGGRLYRTGDRARYRPDGNLEFLGRRDHQVKIRGFRIELGEVEAALSAHPAVREAVVVACADKAGGHRLVAYAVFHGEAPDVGALRGFLEERLPGPFVPSVFVALDRLPLTPNGKVDRRALPAPEAGAEAKTGLAGPRVPVGPRSAHERMIAAIWQEVLQVGKVGVHDNFFDLGGHSLLAAQVHARLLVALGRELSMVDLFRHPTIAALARFLTDGERTAGTVEHRPAVRPEAGREIAIVGMAGRFPGAASVGELWRRLRAGEELISFFSAEELAVAGVDPALLADPAYVRAGGVLAEAELFDAPFFGFSPREAELMDPQHRVFLECAWHALEDAGYDSQHYRGRVGLYAGVGFNTYLHHAGVEQVQDLAGRYQAFISNDKDFVPTRTSYKLDLRGPSVTVQTACSTSLVAVHLACQALLSGDCDMALAGGVAIRAPQATGYLHEEGGILSPDGHCRAFDARAQGTVLGNGVGIVVLKPLARALADGDTIRAVIKGTAINNDGALKIGYTAPSVEGQARVIAEALDAAAVDAETVTYVEAHGTGTPMGDPIEMAALTEVFAARTARKGFCVVGSVKANVGHLDTAAGIVGLIKTVQALEHRELPPSLHFATPNPRLDLARGPFRISSSLTAWESDGPRRAGVSSFGIGGTNAHVVLEEAPEAEPYGSSRAWQLLVLSARTPAALAAATRNLAAALRQRPDLPLADVAHTLRVGRRAFAHRRALLCRGPEEAAAALAAVDPERVLTAVHEPGERPVAFLFSGQGSQHAGMGRGLYENEPVFRRELDACAELLLPHLGLDLRRLLFPAADAAEAAQREIERTAFAQPALFALEWALARLWMAWGLQPQAMLGHSLGEYVAACLAGVFPLAAALALVAARGRLMQSLPAGAMLGVQLPEEAVVPLLGAELSLAAVNGPVACVVSGTVAGVAALERRLDGMGVRHRRLHTSHAFHSAMMDPVLEAFAAEVGKVELEAPRLPFLSNVTGTWITPEEATDPRYWVRHLRGAVRFADGVRTLLSEPDRLLLEVGPGNALSALARQNVPAGQSRIVLASLPHPQEEQPDVAVMLRALGRLWLAGAEVDWAGFAIDEQRRRVPLPLYPFERQRYWLEPRKSAPAEADRLAKKADLADWFYAPFWRQAVPPARFPVGEEAASWLLLGEENGPGGRLVSQLAERLERLGRRVSVVRTGAGFARLAEG